MKQIIAAACGAMLAMTGPLMAQARNGVVVELYTSQGCSSCPTADGLFAGLAGDPRVIPLALHVDYWDYLGWKDVFASPQYTARQKAYARYARDNMVYTPQMVVAGSERIVGSRSGDLEKAIRAEAATAPEVTISLSRRGSTLEIRAAALPGQRREMIVQLVRYTAAKDVAIKRGENAGKTITYHNIVTSWKQVGEWSGSAPLLLETRAEGPEPVVVIVQAEGPAEILGAALLP